MREDSIAKEVQEVLTKSPEEIGLEALEREDSSPLNRPVVEKDIAGVKTETTEENTPNWNVWKPSEKAVHSGPESKGAGVDFRGQVSDTLKKEQAEAPLDAPEQEIASDVDSEEQETTSDEDFEMPLKQAHQAADALLGMSNNLLSVGGGYFIKIRKHKEFFEFEEILQVLDEQNQKNTQRILLDDEDKALLRPLLAQVLKKRAKKLTPEQQLIGAIVSILVKKTQVVMEIRAENKLLEERILEIVKTEKTPSKEEVHFQEKEAEISKEISKEEEIHQANSTEQNSNVTEEVLEEIPIVDAEEIEVTGESSSLENIVLETATKEQSEGL